MQTSFTLAQLADPDVAESEKILRACVHCGFCTATCPTYVLLGDELDSPRGRIYLIKDMLEHDRPATPEVVKHIDRCLSCLSCMTTCPSGVHYMHLVDHARAHIEETYTRPLPDRALRELLGGDAVSGALPRGVAPGPLAKPLAPLLDRARARPPRRHAAAGACGAAAARPRDRAACSRRKGPARGRVAILRNCANEALAPAHQRRGDPAADPPWHRGRAAGGRGVLRRGSSITWARSTARSPRCATTSMPGRARSTAEGSTRS